MFILGQIEKHVLLKENDHSISEGSTGQCKSRSHKFGVFFFAVLEHFSQSVSLCKKFHSSHSYSTGCVTCLQQMQGFQQCFTTGFHWWESHIKTMGCLLYLSGFKTVDLVSQDAPKKVRLFTFPYFSVRSQMSIVEFDGPPSWSLDASETGESTKYNPITSTHGHLVLSPVSLASRDQDGGPSNDLTEKQGTVNSLLQCSHQQQSA